MKTISFAIIACAAIMASCNGNKSNSAAPATDSAAVDTMANAEAQVFEGMLPAADVEGLRYHVAINADSTFSLTEAYMETETKVKDSQDYTGKIETVVKDGNTFYKFATGKDDAVCVKVLNDSTLRVVGVDLEEPVATEGLNYDLKLVK